MSMRCEGALTKDGLGGVWWRRGCLTGRGVDEAFQEEGAWCLRGLLEGEWRWWDVFWSCVSVPEQLVWVAVDVRPDGVREASASRRLFRLPRPAVVVGGESGMPVATRGGKSIKGEVGESSGASGPNRPEVM